MQTQQGTNGASSYVHSTHPRTTHHSNPAQRSPGINQVHDETHSRQFQTDDLKEKINSNKIGNKRTCQPPEIFVFDFTNNDDGVDKTDILKENCFSNGHDTPVALNAITNKTVLNPTPMTSQNGSSSPSLISPNMIQPQHPNDSIITIGQNRNEEKSQTIASLNEPNLSHSKSSSPNCQPSQTMLWC